MNNTYRNYTYETYKSEALGVWFGYVTLKDNSKYIDTDYHDIPIVCHGGLTYKNGDVIGFDCAHSDDVVPSRSQWGFSGPDWATFKDEEYVVNEIKSIIDQLIDLEG